jgi:hypothetical protein
VPGGERLVLSDPARKQVLTWPAIALPDPLQDRLARLFGYFELDGTPGFPLHDHGSRTDAPAQQHIVDPQRNEIAAAKLAVDRKVEHCEIAQTLFQLKTDADRPDLPELKRWFLPDELAAVPGRPRFGNRWL